MPTTAHRAPHRPGDERPASARRRIGLLASVFIGVILLELLVAVGSIRVLAGMRAYIGGESLWAKSQKAAVSELQAYVIDRDPSHYDAFRALLQVNLGGREARQALDRDRPDLERARAGFLAGRNHPEDIDTMVSLFIHLGDYPPLREAIDTWEVADQAIDELLLVGEQLHQRIAAGSLPAEDLAPVLAALQAVDARLTQHEEAFSTIIGDLARRVESIATVILVATVVLLGACSIFAALWTYRLLVSTFAERQRIERSIQSQQRLESLGRMAGGVAHDFNNLMTAVLGFSEIVSKKLGHHSPVKTELAEIQHAGQRASELTQKLLAFSRKQYVRPDVLDLNQLVRDVMKMLSPAIEEHIKPDFQLHPEPLLVLGEAGQLEQVLVNLVLNARDAMPNGGQLVVKTKLDSGAGHDDQRAVLIVDDNGVGMDDEIKAHAFEPFYTTKPVGKGVGLGLSTAYGVISQLGGTIKIQDKSTQGCQVIVHLPVCDEALTKPPEETIDKRAESTATEVDGTVLVVEDDAAVRSFTATILREAGYRVLAAGTAAQAMDIAHDADCEPQVLITDLVLPDIDGYTLAKRLINTWPQLKVLHISGYPADTLQALGGSPSDPGVLRKPFSRNALLTAVAATLTTPPHHTSSDH